MIRTVVKPANRDISIKLPESFVGKQVEVIAFTVDEAQNNLSNQVTDSPLTHIASEKVLAKDWLTEDEDLAWQNL